MNLSHSSAVTETPFLQKIHSLGLAVTLAVTSCISPQSSQTPVSIGANTPSTCMSKDGENDIDNPHYCTLVGASAQIQAGIEYLPEFRSLGHIKQFITEEMKRNHIPGKVTVASCNPTENEEGLFTYIIISVDGIGTTEIYARNPDVAREIVYQIRLNDEHITQ